MAQVEAVAAPHVFSCRCGVDLWSRDEFKSEDVTRHQTFCILAPGDTIQSDGMGHQGERLLFYVGLKARGTYWVDRGFARRTRG